MLIINIIRSTQLLGFPVGRNSGISPYGEQMLQKFPHTHSCHSSLSNEGEEDQSTEPERANKSAALFIIPLHHHPPC